jgi:uncharacterized protein (TIGR02466 family)
MPVKPWFPTFVYEAPLQTKGKDDYVRSLLADCRKVRELDTEGQLWCQSNYPAGYTSYGTLRALHRTVPSFVGLERKIWRHVQRFTSRLDMDLTEATLAMTDCWVNLMSREAVHPLHLHPGAVISGTFYVSAPAGCSGIRFEDPRLEMSSGAPPRRADCRQENRKQITYEVESGKIILFESWLRHGVEPNTTVEERVSISFNYTWI